MCPRCLVELGLSFVTSGAPGPPGPESPAEGRLFGRYELLEVIARGGMGIVYKARQSGLKRVVALKMLPPGLFDQPEFVQRFQTEAETIARLQHPNIVAIHEVGEHDRQPFFAMDFIPGRTLAQLVRDGPLAADRAATYLKRIAEAVDHAHARGILHRDLKPSNIIIDDDDQPWVTDFGLAKHFSDSAAASAGCGLTLTGQILGSPNYVPPEQASGQHARIGPAADIYSLGAILYHLVTGRPPFQADTLTALLREVVDTEPLQPRRLNPSIPRDIETICLKCLEKQPSRRYAKAGELAEELGRFLEGRPVRARHVHGPERAWRWCRRRPLLASLSSGLALAILLGAAGVLREWQRAEAHASLLRKNAYAADMKAVQHALDANDLRTARELLYLYAPGGDSPERRAFDPDLRDWEWRYLWKLCQSDERFVLQRYEGPVTALVFSADGRWLAVHRGDGEVALWDTSTRKSAWEIPGKRGYQALAFSPKEDVLALGNEDSPNSWSVILMDVSKRQQKGCFPLTAQLVSTAFSPDGVLLASLAYDGSVRVWEVHSRELRYELTTPGFGAGQPGAYTPRPRAEGSGKPRSSGAQRQFRSGPIVTAHYGGILFSPDGSLLAVGESTPQVRLVNAQTGEQVRELIASAAEPNVPDGITAMAFSPDSSYLAAGCGARNHQLHVWETSTGRERQVTGHTGWISGLAFSPDGAVLASVSSDQALRLWRFGATPGESFDRPAVLRGNVDEVWAVAWSPDGKDLVTASRDGFVRYWDPAARSQKRYVTVPEPILFWGPSFLPDSQSFLVLSAQGAVERRDGATAAVLERLPWLGSNHTSVSLSTDGHWLALGDARGNIRIWDLNSRSAVTNLLFPGAGIFALFFSPRGTYLHAGIQRPDGALQGRLWEVRGWKEYREETGLPGADGAFDANDSADDRMIAVSYVNGTAAWWDLRTRRRVGELFDCGGSLSHVLFSPDGKWFATGTVDGTLTLWEVAGRKPKPMPHGHRNNLHDLAFTREGRRLVASGTGPEGIIQFWDVATGRDVLSLPGEPGWYLRIGFSPDGNTLYAASREGTALLWHAPSLQEIAAREKWRKP